MSQTTAQFKRQLPKNVLMSVLSFVTYALSAIWLTPYLVNHLGAAAYGLIPIAGLFTQYVSLITANLSSAVNRFLTIELQKPDGNPNSIFNSSLALYAILILIQLPLFSLGIFYADSLFSIPTELKTDALLLLGCSAGAFLVGLLNGVFGVSLYSNNRLDISSSLNLGRILIRLILIILLFSIFGPKLRFIGYIDLTLNVLMLGSSIFFWKKFTPELFITFKQLDLSILKPVFKMSMWTLINNMGALLFVRTDIWIINRFISPVIAGQYAAILVVSNFLRQLGMLFNGQFGPTIIGYWAKGELKEMRRLISLAMKVLSIGLAVPAALICMNSHDILALWLGADFIQLAPTLTVLCLSCALTVNCYPLYHMQVASNHVQAPALVALAAGIMNIAASYYVGVSLEKGPLGIAAVTAISLLAHTGVFTTIYSARILKISFHAFWWPICTGIAMLGVVWLISLIPLSMIEPSVIGTWLSLFAKCSIQGLLSLVIGFYLFITKEERACMLNMLPDRWLTLIPERIR